MMINNTFSLDTPPARSMTEYSFLNKALDIPFSQDITVLFVGIILILLACIGTVSANQDKTHIYTTWEGSEPDKGATAWLIKRFVDKHATFVVEPYGEPLGEGVAFDVPEAKFRRTHNASTYETLLHDYKIADPAVQKIGRIMHDLEINAWRKKVIAETLIMDGLIKELQTLYADQMVPFDCYIAFFDQIYALYNADKKLDDNFPLPNLCRNLD